MHSRFRCHPYYLRFISLLNITCFWKFILRQKISHSISSLLIRFLYHKTSLLIFRILEEKFRPLYDGLSDMNYVSEVNCFRSRTCTVHVAVKNGKQCLSRSVTSLSRRFLLPPILKSGRRRRIDKFSHFFPFLSDACVTPTRSSAHSMCLLFFSSFNFSEFVCIVSQIRVPCFVDVASALAVCDKCFRKT